MYVQSTPTYRACIHNTKIGDADGYSVGDLVVPHPTLSGYWKVFGRADDQLMHNTGEKVCVRRRHLSITPFLTTRYVRPPSNLDKPGPVR